MISTGGRRPTSYMGSSSTALMWPLLLSLICCTFLIVFGPVFWNIPLLGSHIQDGEWLVLPFAFAIWLLFNCYRRELSLIKTFVLCLIYFWSIALEVWIGFLGSEFHTVTDIRSVICSIVVYPMCFAIAASVVGIAVYTTAGYVTHRIKRSNVERGD